MPPTKFQLKLAYSLRRCGLKNLNIAAMAAILETGMILAILNLHVTPMPSTKFGSIRRCSGADLEQIWFEDFQAGCCGDYPRYWKGTILAILNLHVHSMPPIQFQLNLTRFGRRCLLNNFEMATGKEQFQQF